MNKIVPVCTSAARQDEFDAARGDDGQHQVTDGPMVQLPDGYIDIVYLNTASHVQRRRDSIEVRNGNRHVSACDNRRSRQLGDREGGARDECSEGCFSFHAYSQ